MRLSLMISFFILILPRAHASTQAIFSKDGEKVTLSLLGFPQNTDALALYNSVLAPPQDQMGKWSKRIDILQANGAKLFDLSCVFSKIAAGTGSCILILHASPNLIMDPSAGRARFELRGAEGAKLAAMFAPPSSGGEIFKSSDGLMVMSYDGGFVLTYR